MDTGHHEASAPLKTHNARHCGADVGCSVNVFVSLRDMVLVLSTVCQSCQHIRCIGNCTNRRVTLGESRSYDRLGYEAVHVAGSTTVPNCAIISLSSKQSSKVSPNMTTIESTATASLTLSFGQMTTSNTSSVRGIIYGWHVIPVIGRPFGSTGVCSALTMRSWIIGSLLAPRSKTT